MTDAPITGAAHPPRWQLVVAFFAIYVIWGSAYISIHFAIQTIPPFISSASRFVLAGVLLYGWMRLRGVPNPTRREWVSVTIGGFLFFAVDNGCLVWAQQYVPSGMTSLIIGSTPIFIVLIDWFRPGGRRPTLPVFVGVVLGAVGLALLVDPANMVVTSPNIWFGILALVCAAFAWAIGTIYNQHAHFPKSIMMSTAAQLLTGAIMLVIVSIVSGETATFDASKIAPLSVAAIVYLAIASSIFGFGSYLWLLRVSKPSRVATYAYINPIIAIVLGWALAGEPITARTLIAAAIILGSVMLINNARSHVPTVQKDEFDEPAIIPETP